jgi:adenosylcobinamide-GDP ribazoletransferase
VDRFFGALRFFTRLPVPERVGHHTEHLARAMRYFPLVGLIVGTIGAFAWIVGSIFWESKGIAVLFALAATLWVTGAFHEDGLADTADGFGGGWDKARILEIMRDSRVGTFGMAAFVLVLLGRFQALVALPETWIAVSLLAGHAASRFCAATLLRCMVYARDGDDRAKAKPLARRPGGLDWCVAGVTAFLPSLLLPWRDVLWAWLFAAIATFWLARLFHRWIGGYTGDCLGATQQAAELAFYLGLLARLPPGQ